MKNAVSARISRVSLTKNHEEETIKCAAIIIINDVETIEMQNIFTMTKIATIV